MNKEMSDKTTKDYMIELSNKAGEYCDFVNQYNECAYSDRIIEDVVRTAKELEYVYEAHFSDVFHNTRYVENLKQAANLRGIVLKNDTAVKLIKKHGLAVVKWSINDYINVIDRYIKRMKSTN